MKYDLGDYRIITYAKSNDNKRLYLHIREAADGHYKKENYFVYFDVEKGKAISQIELRGGGSSFWIYEHYITRDIGNTRDVHDPYTGSRMWYTNGYLAFVDTAKDLCVTQDGVCFNMLTGKKLWSHKIGVKYDWASKIYQPDTGVLMTITDGLHYVNLNTGEGWFFPISMLKCDMTTEERNDRMRMVVATMAFGAVGAYLASPAYDTTYRSNFSSNIARKGQDFFFAGNKNMVCISGGGKEKWDVSLPYKTAASEIIVRDDTLLFLSVGMKNRADPYLAAFNTKDGTLSYKTLLNGQTKITEYKYCGETMLVKTKNAIILYSILTGKELAFAPIGKDVEGFETIIKGDNVIIVDGISNRHISLADAYHECYFLTNKSGEILILDSTLHIVELLSNKSYGKKELIDDFFCILNMPDGISVEKRGIVVAELDSMPQLKCNDRFVHITPKTITITNIPLSE